MKQKKNACGFKRCKQRMHSATRKAKISISQVKTTSEYGRDCRAITLVQIPLKYTTLNSQHIKAKEI